MCRDVALRESQRQDQRKSGLIGEETESGRRRCGSGVDQDECCLPAVAARSQVRDAAASGADIGQRRNRRQRIVGRREAQSQHADLPAGRRIELDGAADVRRDRELRGQHERRVPAATQRNSGSSSADDRTRVVANDHRNDGACAETFSTATPSTKLLVLSNASR